MISLNTGPLGAFILPYALKQPVCDRLVMNNFECKRCGNCCRVPGYVRLASGELESLSRHMGLAVGDFAGRYTRLTEDRRGLSLNERDDHTCVFLTEEGTCRVNDC